MGFPCNQFGGQEPGTESQIKQFTSKYGVQFLLFSKIKVNGKETHPVYQFLRHNSELFDPNKGTVNEIPWNFAKFLVDREGNVIKYFNPRVEPFSIRNDIEALLKSD